MIITTKVVWDISRLHPNGRFPLLEHCWFNDPYVDETEGLKKGRESQSKITDQQMALASQNQATRQQELGGVNDFVNQVKSTAPGQLSPYAQAQLASDLGHIHTTYSNMKQAGFRGIAQRGLGSAPTGAVSSLTNTLDRASGADENAAYEDALKRQYGENLDALKAQMGLVSEFNPEGDLSQASSSAARQAQMGSTLGDIGAGITTGASVFKALKGKSG